MALIKCKECGTEISSKAETCPKCGARVKTKGSGCGLLIALVFLIGLMASIFSNSNKGSVSLPPNPKNEALDNMQITKLNWYKAGFDNIMEIDATFLNNGRRGVKDIELTCEHYSNSGTNIDRNRKVIYEVVPAGASKSIKKFNMGFINSQATRTNCSITDLVLN